NTGVPNMEDPFFVVEHDSKVKFTDFNLFRIENPILIKDTSELEIGAGCGLGGPMDFAFHFPDPAPMVRPSGFQPGTRRIPSLILQDCRVGNESMNTTNSMDSAFSYTAPDPHLQAVG